MDPNFQKKKKRAARSGCSCNPQILHGTLGIVFFFGSLFPHKFKQEFTVIYQPMYKTVKM
jgi:hypothetical protein